MIDYEKYRVDGELPLWAELFKKSEQFLEPALKYDDTHNLQDIADAIDNCSMQLWPSKNAALVTQIQNYPRCRVLHVYLAGGKMKELIDLIPHIEEFAQHMGCHKITLTGRRGWQRIFKNFKNVKPTHFWLSMEV